MAAPNPSCTFRFHTELLFIYHQFGKRKQAPNLWTSSKEGSPSLYWPNVASNSAHSPVSNAPPARQLIAELFSPIEERPESCQLLETLRRKKHRYGRTTSHLLSAV